MSARSTVDDFVQPARIAGRARAAEIMSGF